MPTYLLAWNPMRWEWDNHKLSHCHAMIHKRHQSPYTIEEIREMLNISG